jgi:hypothetical protein
MAVAGCVAAMHGWRLRRPTVSSAACHCSARIVCSWLQMPHYLVHRAGWRRLACGVSVAACWPLSGCGCGLSYLYNFVALSGVCVSSCGRENQRQMQTGEVVAKLAAVAAYQRKW